MSWESYLPGESFAHLWLTELHTVLVASDERE